MKMFANRTRRIIFMCGTLLAPAGLRGSLRAQEAQEQDTSRSDISNFDVFLDTHADIDAQLRANPSLFTNAEFLASHPQLENYLNQHPAVQTAIKENPSHFMEREKRLAARKTPRDTNPNPDLNRQEREKPLVASQTPRYTNVSPDLNRQEVATMEQFLAAPGPAVLQAVVDPFEPPLPAKVTGEQAWHFAESLARGEPHRGKIAVTALSNRVRELI